MKKVGKGGGGGGVKHHSEIEAEHLKKLYKSFDTNTPAGLQEKDRSRKSTRKDEKQILRKSGCDREAISVSMYERSGQKSQHQRCPVRHSGRIPFDTRGEYRRQIHPNVQFARSSSTYISLLHPIQPALWQRPRVSVKATDSIW